MNSINEKIREMRLCWYGHMQRMEENIEVIAIVDMIVPGKRPWQEAYQEGNGWIASELPKGYAGTADHPGECPGQNILEIKNLTC